MNPVIGMVLRLRLHGCSYCVVFLSHFLLYAFVLYALDRACDFDGNFPKVGFRGRLNF